MIPPFLSVVSAASNHPCELTRPEVRPTSRAEAPDDDGQWVLRCVQGSDEATRVHAFGVLLSRHRERVLNLAWQMLGSPDDAEDAAQEAFALAFRSLPTFRGDARFGTWIYRIAINVCLSRKRANKPCDEWNDELNVAPSGDEDAASRAEKRLQVARTLERLSPSSRAILVLREIHDLSYDEIARILNVPVGTVRSRLSKARQQFIALWEAE